MNLHVCSIYFHESNIFPISSILFSSDLHVATRGSGLYLDQ